MKDFKLTPTGIVAVVALAFLCASSMFVAWKLLFGRPVEDVRLASLSPSVPAPASTLLAGEEGVTPIVKTTASETPMDVEPALQASGTLTHTVQAGENLYRISLAYGVSVTDIMSANSLFDSRFITVGQELRIPIDRAVALPAPPVAAVTMETPESTMSRTPVPLTIVNGLPLETILVMPENVRRNVRQVYVRGQQLGR